MWVDQLEKGNHVAYDEARDFLQRMLNRALTPLPRPSALGVGRGTDLQLNAEMDPSPPAEEIISEYDESALLDPLTIQFAGRNEWHRLD